MVVTSLLGVNLKTGNLTVNTKTKGWRLTRKKMMNNWCPVSDYSLIIICASHILAHVVYAASP